MQNKIRGLLIFSKIIKENNLYVKFLTQNDEIISGLVYGGATSKKKNIFQLGFFFNIIVTKSKFNSINTINAEISKPFILNLINDKYKLLCLVATVSIINLSIIEGQKIQKIFEISEKFISSLINKKKWLILFFKYLFKLLKIIGYEIDYISNSNQKFFNINTLEFSNDYNNFCYCFPHKLINSTKKINHKEISDIFIIFEEVFKKNHLINMNIKLPLNFIIFKKFILNYLIKL